MNSELQAQTKTATSSLVPARGELLQRKCDCGQHTIAGGECSGCNKKREGTIQRAALSHLPVNAHDNAVPPIVNDVLRSSGQPLDAETRGFMESRFGHDFSRVRVHTDSQAAESASAVNARAYTVGQDVVFGSQQYAPTTNEGQLLLAHELVHVVQQATSASGPPVAVSDPSDKAEQNAEVLSRQVIAAGIAQQPIATSRSSTLHRLPFGIQLPTGLRALDPVEETMARGVYGGSLNYGQILLSDALGGGGRPFTLYVPSLLPFTSGVTVINIGPGPYATPGSDRNLLIHELAHSWQSQHHPNPAQYMVNSLASQAAAGAAGGSAYCYIPGRWFGLYGAEQIAQQVENGESNIVSHVAAAGPGGTDFANVISLQLPHWETRGAPGVRC